MSTIPVLHPTALAEVLFERYSVTLDISFVLICHQSNHETIIRYVLLECKNKKIHPCGMVLVQSNNNKGMKMKWYELARSRMKERSA